MKRVTRLLAALLAVCMMTSAAWALTPAQLGEILKEEYAGEIPGQVWKETTVEGMLAALGDPFSHYFTAAEYAAFQGEMADDDSHTTATVAVDGHVARVELTSFGPDTYGILKDAIEKNDPAVDSWIVDLRENRGGELNAAVDAMSAFLGGGELVFLRDKGDKLYSAKGEHQALTMDPVIVLTGKKTASAGELFAAGARDRRGGLVIGSRTYGKGVAQSAFTKEQYPEAFADGSALLLTTSRVFSSGFSSNNVMGVIPHLMVEEDMVEPVARLFTATAPKGNNTGYLRVHLGGWRWYVNTAAADKAALTALLEALPPQAEVFQGSGGQEWHGTDAQNVAKGLGLAGYQANEFPDVEDSPYRDAINALKTYGMLKGNEKGEYLPKAGLDRATLCALLAQAMGYPKATSEPSFADTPKDAWYTPYVTTLSKMGIVNGYDDGKFHPNDPISHEQFMVILARVAARTNHMVYDAMKNADRAEILANQDLVRYNDWAKVEVWLLDGQWQDAAKNIDPFAAATREEAGYCMWSMLAGLGILP